MSRVSVGHESDPGVVQMLIMCVWFCFWNRYAYSQTAFLFMSLDLLYQSMMLYIYVQWDLFWAVTPLGGHLSFTAKYLWKKVAA